MFPLSDGVCVCVCAFVFVCVYTRPYYICKSLKGASCHRPLVVTSPDKHTPSLLTTHVLYSTCKYLRLHALTCTSTLETSLGQTLLNKNRIRKAAAILSVQYLCVLSLSLEECAMVPCVVIGLIIIISKFTQVEGKGNGIKTVIVNMVEIGKSLQRPPSCKP